MSSLTSHARVVIIGGGVGGASIAYHLTLMGWRDVVVLERSEITSGSTFHSAGLVGQLRTSSNLTKMIRYSTDLYRRLKDETEVDPGWREVGSLRLASSPARMEELRHLVAVSRSFGLPLELVSANDAQKLFPLMTTEGVEGAVYLPTDGYIDPTSLTMALVAGAKARGAQFCTHTRVQSITTRSDSGAGVRVSAVVTDQGTIETEIVVNAAGQWAGEIGRMVGLNFPIVSMAHLYLITKPMGITQTLPTMRDPDLLVYYRQEVGGLIMGGYERQPAAWALEGIPQDFNGKLLPPDWERFAPLMENAIRRVPEIENAQVSLLLNGPEGFTPDAEYLMGPTTVNGFWIAAAFCAHGLAGAGGIGKTMAEWIIEGHPEWDLWRLDHRRFGANYASQKYVLARTVETYGEYYDVHYPNKERASARPLRMSPAYYRLKELGAVFGEKTGWERPNWFERTTEDGGRRTDGIKSTKDEGRKTNGESDSLVARHSSFVPRGWTRHHWSPMIGVEHVGTRERAGLFDETSFSKISVRGPKALETLQYLCANDVDKPIGTVVYTQMLNPRGGIECDFTVTRLGQHEFRIVTGTAFGAHDLAHIQTHAPQDGVLIEDVTSQFATFGLWGPRARDILARTIPPHLVGTIANGEFPYMTAKRLAVGDVPTLALRVTYVGELGWEFYCPMEYGQQLWDTLWNAGQEFGIVAGGYRAIDSLRVEKGYRYWSGDIGPDYTPYEAGLHFAVKLNKGDFIGRDALVKQKEAGIRKKLCCITIDDATAIAIGNEPVRFQDGVVGWVTTASYGYSVEKSIAYTYLPIQLATLGTRLDVEMLGERIGAVVAQDPQWDAKGERLRS